ncbi:permease [Chloroflexota bacterium]
MEIILQLFKGGLDALVEYLSLHVLTCLIPAFFIAGAISVFISQAAVLKYFGPRANKFLSYGVASVSGTILAVCSCTVLPLFGGIYKRGAGLGPAIAFLYSGPAINVLAIVYSARLLGYDLGVARAVGAILFSVVIGLIMAFIFRDRKSTGDNAAFDMLLSESKDGKPIWKVIVFFIILVGILVFAASMKWIVTGVLLVILGIVLWRWFTGGEIKQWMLETGRFARLIIPWLLVGVFAAGILKAVIPESWIAGLVGSGSVLSNFIASFFGVLMYFATLTEVPVIKAFIDLGMGKGPALALLLAGPALSLPSMLVIRNIIGTRKTLIYIGLVVIMSTFTGWIFGFFV